MAGAALRPSVQAAAALVPRRLPVRQPLGELERIGLASPQDLLNLYTGDRDEGLAYAGDGPVVMDDRPYVEYYRSLPTAGDRLPDLSGLSHDQRKIVKE
jgi:hypothetical protein